MSVKVGLYLNILSVSTPNPYILYIHIHPFIWVYITIIHEMMVTLPCQHINAIYFVARNLFVLSLFGNNAYNSFVHIFEYKVYKNHTGKSGYAYSFIQCSSQSLSLYSLKYTLSHFENLSVCIQSWFPKIIILWKFLKFGHTLMCANTNDVAL